ncbi:hypothetical protein WJX84_003015, partial [Apatococcus fuscideae]
MISHLGGSCPLNLSPINRCRLRRPRCRSNPCRSSPPLACGAHADSLSRHNSWAAQPSCSQSPSSSPRQPRLPSRPPSKSSSQRQQQHCKSNIRTKATSSSADAPADPKEMPGLIMRMLAAICYMVPWLDVIGMGRAVWRRLINLVILLWIPGPLKGWYYSSQFTPLIVFFMLFLAVVKNTSLPHFVRFHCMQAVMLDIVVMLFVILQPYFPAEVRWSPFMNFYDIISFNTCMPAIIYCIFWAL